MPTRILGLLTLVLITAANAGAMQGIDPPTISCESGSVASIPCQQNSAFSLVHVVELGKATSSHRKQVCIDPAILAPGDLIVGYMKRPNSVKTREWLHAFVPYGHSLIVLDPHDSCQGLLESRKEGCQRVGYHELRYYERVLVFRLNQAHRLNLARLIEFANVATAHVKGYRYRGLVGQNGNLTPNTPERILKRYTCSTMVVAAYHYAGLTLDVANHSVDIIKPLDIARACGTWNQFACPAQTTAANN